MKKRVLIALAFFLCILWMIGYINVNAKYSAPKVETYTKNMQVPVHSLGFEMVVTDCYFVDSAEKDSKIPDYESIVGDKYELLVAEVTFSNPGKESKEIFVPRFNLQIGASWSTGIRWASYTFLNETNSFRIELQPGESTEALIPYLVSCPSLSEEHWQHYLNLDYKLIVDLYPVKQVITLDIR